MVDIPTFDRIETIETATLGREVNSPSDLLNIAITMLRTQVKPEFDRMVQEEKDGENKEWSTLVAVELDDILKLIDQYIVHPNKPMITTTGATQMLYIQSLDYDRDDNGQITLHQQVSQVSQVLDPKTFIHLAAETLEQSTLQRVQELSNWAAGPTEREKAVDTLRNISQGMLSFVEHGKVSVSPINTFVVSAKSDVQILH